MSVICRPPRARPGRSRHPPVVSGRGSTDYLVNWLVRKDKRNIQLSAIAAVDNEYGYCFGAHLNFDPSMDSKTVQAAVETNGDLSKPYPHRRFARLWLNADHERATAKSLNAKRHKQGLPAEIDETYADAMTRDGIETRCAVTSGAAPGIRYADPWRVHDVRALISSSTPAGQCPEVAFFPRPGPRSPGRLPVCVRTEIQGHTADAFYVRIAKDLTVDEKRQKYLEAKMLFVQAEAAHPTLLPKEVKLLLIKERLASMTTAREMGRPMA